MTPGERIGEFGQLLFGSRRGWKTTFATALGMKQSNLHKYLKLKDIQGRKPGHIFLNRLTALGCNVDWILTGEGSMYSENDAGRKLRETTDPIISETFIYRVPTVLEKLSALDDEVVELRAELAGADADARAGILARIVAATESKCKLLEQEFLLQRGQLIAYDKMFDVIRRMAEDGER